MAYSMEHIKSPYYQRLSGDVKVRYDKKIQKCGGVDPYTLKPKNLSYNSKDFPQITIYDITDYMIHSVSSYTKRSFENYKGTEAYNFFESGFVVNVGSKNNDNLAIVVGKVLHSQRLNDSASHVWILAKLDGKVICAHCTCLAGLSETCSHVGAICFAINKISESKETKSVTDILCKWNVPKFKEVSMSAAKDIDWRFSTRERATNETSFLEYCNSISPLSDERIGQFLNECQSVGDEVALRSIIFPSERKRLTNLRDEIFLSSLYKEKYQKKSLYELIHIGSATLLTLSEDEVREIFKLTLLRLKSKCYLGLRRGRITGSTFKDCCTANVRNPSIVTIKRVISQTKNLGHVPSIKYQIQNKKKAIKQYFSQAVMEHEDFVHTECGLIINPNLPYFAGSPDGLIYCSCHGDGCLEIICLKIEEIDTLDDFLTRKPNNMFVKCGDNYTVERSHDLYYRIQLQINLNCSKYCDCIIWSPQKAFVVKVFADTDFWNEEMQKALNFHQQVIMPELLGKFYTQKKDITDSDEENEVDVDLQRFELLALEIEILESEECEDIISGTVSPEKKDLADSDAEIYEVGDDLQRFHLLALEIDILGSEECEDIISGSVLPETITSPHFTRGIETKNASQQSEAVFKPELQQNDHDQNVEESNEATSQPLVTDLKSMSLEEICETFSDHQVFLTSEYDRLIREPKNNYWPKDLPECPAFDLVTAEQFKAMVEVAESKLETNVEHYNSTDIIFQAIIAEWAYKVFCSKYNMNRQEAVAAVNEIVFAQLENDSYKV